MAQPRFELASGPVNGTNRAFAVSTGYAPGTTAVFLNGQLLVKENADGWSESNPPSGTVLLNLAPRPGDLVQVFFTAASPYQHLQEEIQRIYGELSAVETIHGRLREVARLRGTLKPLGSARA